MRAMQSVCQRLAHTSPSMYSSSFSHGRGTPWSVTCTLRSICSVSGSRKNRWSPLSVAMRCVLSCVSPHPSRSGVCVSRTTSSVVRFHIMVRPLCQISCTRVPCQSTSPSPKSLGRLGARRSTCPLWRSTSRTSECPWSPTDSRRMSGSSYVSPWEKAVGSWWYELTISSVYMAGGGSSHPSASPPSRSLRAAPPPEVEWDHPAATIPRRTATPARIVAGDFMLLAAGGLMHVLPGLPAACCGVRDSCAL
mmetsp:Transcript_3031/g.10261  ORF Transcript_3031/g.10261 Transcript_3031/m.10261 type:complete len:250 (+) Transcript_3031:299-1048(+)